MAQIRRPAVLRLLFYAVVLVCLALLWLRAGTVRLTPAVDASQAPALLMRDLDGATVSLSDFAGKAVVINVWAGWCGPCRSEIPAFRSVAGEYRDAGLVVLGLNVDDLPADGIARVGEQLEIDYPIVLAVDGFDGPFREPRRIPHTWFVDREGRLRGSHAGVLSAGALRHAVERLLES